MIYISLPEKVQKGQCNRALGSPLESVAFSLRECGVAMQARGRGVAFYLAMEEYVARYVAEEECFFMWQVEPSVIFGRNQLIENEVNLNYCKKHGIQTLRVC